MIPLQVISHKKIINHADKEVAARTKEVFIMKNKVFVIKSILNMLPPRIYSNSAQTYSNF